MSLNDPTSAPGETGRHVVLRTCDQYTLWKARITSTCWAATRKDVFEVTDQECKEASNLFITGGNNAPRIDWVGKCWYLICASIHDDLIIKLTHVKHGSIASLIQEIHSALLINISLDVKNLRGELYSATMAGCSSDLQSYISFIKQRYDKLSFLKAKIEEADVVNIFLKGLIPIFNPVLVHYAINPLPADLDAAILIVRNYAANPTVFAELTKAKSAGLSQNLFPAVTANKDRQLCKSFATKGNCSYGENCKFLHTAPPLGISNRNPRRRDVCSNCRGRGHTDSNCKKPRANSLAAPAAKPPMDANSFLSVPHDPDDFDVEMKHNESTCAFTFTTAVATDSKPTSDLFAHDISVVLSAKMDSLSNTGWVLDSGATACATFDEKDCVDVRSCNVRVTAAGSVFFVKKIGTAVISAKTEKGLPMEVKMTDCLISEYFPYKLLAVSKFTKKNYCFSINNDRMRISNASNDIVFIALRDAISGLFFFSLAPILPELDYNSLLAKSYMPMGKTGDNLDFLWKMHFRHGHRNFSDLSRQYNLSLPSNLPACTSCVMGKSHTHPHFSNGFQRATRRAQGFHSDFRGPFSCPTPSGALYLLTITDDFSRRIFGFLVKTQSEWFDIWIKFVARIESEIGNKNCISWILSDNGAVYKSTAMNAFCAQKGIQQRYSPSYGQWMDHTAERNMRTIGEMALTTLIHANMPKRAWGWAILLACEVLNRTTELASANRIAGAAPNATRLERWHGVKLPGQTKALYPFGCLAFKHVPGVIRGKLDAHAIPMAYLGIDTATRSYLLGSLYDLQTCAAVEVTFIENVFPFRKFKANDSPASLLWGADHVMETGDPRLGMFAPDSSDTFKTLDKAALKSIGAIPTDGPVDKAPEHKNVVVDAGEVPSSDDADEDVADVPLRRSTRNISVPARNVNPYRDINAAPFLLSVDATLDCNVHHVLSMLTEATLDSFTPKNAFDALRSPFKDKWLLAMQREKDCHVKNGTFGHELALSADDVKPIPADWVFKIKHRGAPIKAEDLSERQFKARVVVRGQYMREGLNYNDTFAPVAKPATLRALLAVATKYDCLLDSGDVETAFLTAKMDCEVWVRMPPFWGKEEDPVEAKNPKTGRPRLLLKGVPGIPQGSRLFYETIAARLIAMGYKPAKSDKCLFINSALKERNAVLLWVDDFIYMHENEDTFVSFMRELRQKFTVPSVGPLHCFIGISITRDIENKKMFLKQTGTIDVLLERANLTGANGIGTPCPPGFIFTKADSPESTPPNVTAFRSLIALANFISCWTRPDIAYTVNKLCKFMSMPGEKHWKVITQLIKFLGMTREDGLCFDFSSDAKPVLPGLHAFTDSSFADCVDSGRSTLGYVCFFGTAITSWYSKLNTYVTTCTNHSEYCALALGAKEVEWQVLLFSELEPAVVATPVPVLVDNSGIISMVFNPVDHQSNKHVRVGCHYTRELTANKIIAPQRVSTNVNLADVFTKSLSGPVFSRLSACFMSRCVSPMNFVYSFVLSANDSSASDDDREPSTPIRDSFQRDWPFASIVQRELGADSFDSIETGDTFNTGRRKYDVNFYNVRDGKKFLISCHLGMRMISKSNVPYMVCLRQPKNAADESKRPPPNYSPSSPCSPIPADSSTSTSACSSSTPTQSSIVLTTPSPSITCDGCGIGSNVLVSFLVCSSCAGRNFSWSCACSAVTPRDNSHPTNVTLHSPPTTRRPPRNRSAKSWSLRIKYASPINRRTVYHSLDCSRITGSGVIESTIEFANAYQLKPASCCHGS